MRKKILDILTNKIWYSFESILAGVVISQLNDPHLNAESVKRVLSQQELLHKELQEMVAAGLIIFENGYFRKT
jgi:predicted transcriptional regulator